jgi:hypothetical protein
MATNPSNWMPELIGPVNVYEDGEQVERRRGGINLIGPTITDNEAQDRLDIDFTGLVGGGSGAPGGSNGQLQYRVDATTFGGIAGATTDGTTTTIKDANLEIVDDVDATKKAKFQCSGISTATTRTFTFPDATTTLVGIDVTQTLTNKTISLASNTLTFTSAELRTACSDETGTGALVFANTPTLVTPEIGAATGTSLNLSGGLTLGTDLTVPNGGTGASSFTSGSFLVGAGAGALTDTGAALSISGSTVSANVLINWGNPANSFPSSGYNRVFEGIGDWLVAKEGVTNATALNLTSGLLTIGSNDAGAQRYPTVNVRGDVVELFASSGGVNCGRIKLNSSGIHFGDQGATGQHYLTLGMPDLAADRTLNVPLITGTDTISVLGLAQTYSAAKTFSAIATFSAGTKHANNQIAYWRNAADSADLAGLQINSSNDLILGSPTNPGNVYAFAGTGGTFATRATTHALDSADGSVRFLTTTASAITANVAIVEKESAMGALAIDWSLGNSFTKTLASGGNTITFSNDTNGETITVCLTTHASGSTVTWPAGVKWSNGGAEPTQTATGGAIDIYTLKKIAGTVYGVHQANFA